MRGRASPGCDEALLEGSLVRNSMPICGRPRVAAPLPADMHGAVSKGSEAATPSYECAAPVLFPRLPPQPMRIVSPPVTSLSRSLMPSAWKLFARSS